jgi:hypothetical protein
MILATYDQFASFSGLNLNLHKTVVIPLWEVSTKEARYLLVVSSPKAKDMSYASCGTYLGFAVGPTRQEHMWQKCMEKFTSRATTWKDSHQGMHHSCTIYNVFVVTVLSYIWQLSAPPQEALSLEKMAVRKLFPGPGAWIQPADMWRLRDAWGFSTRLISIQHKATAVAVRVCLKEAPQFRLQHREMQRLLSHSDQVTTKVRWNLTTDHVL